MKKILVLFFALIGSSFLIYAGRSIARDNSSISDWYIKEFNSEITVNKDSSLDIIETIEADCGSLPNKHGIFRVIPYQSYGTNNETFKTPITISSITDQSGKPYYYEKKINRSDHSISLKIGEAEKTVTGINNYVIKYHVDNVMRTANANFDELYWNLNGNFWQIDIDNFQAKIIFPEDFDNQNSEINLYSGSYGNSTSDISEYSWESHNILHITSNESLAPGEGITISTTYPKNFFIPYEPPFWDKYALLIYLLMPLTELFICYKLWRSFGQDPSVSDTIAPEFEIPEKLAPIDFGILYSDGIMHNNYLTASIVNLAVGGQIKIEEIEKKSIFGHKDYKLVRLKQDSGKLSQSEQKLMESLFENKTEILISDLKNKFYTNISEIRKSSMDFLSRNNFIIKSSRSWMIAFIIIGSIHGFLAIFSFGLDTSLAWILLFSASIWLIFSPLMKRRTFEGAKLFMRLKGFELYMRKAEIYRQQWLEKQNIFEQFLPYAIVFGIAKEWSRNMKSIYGEQFMSSYHPVWYYGYSGNFEFDSFGDTITSMSSTISTTLSSNPSSSGSGGGGFSGGGGGGGGGGGW